MDETRARAALPGLDIEVTHRRLPDEGAEYLSVSLRATPSFEAVGRFLEPYNPVRRWLAPAMAPFLAPWLRLARAAWAPWLPAAGRAPLREAAREEWLPPGDDPPAPATGRPPTG